MSTEQKPPATELPKTEPKAEPNALATSLASGWEQFTQGKLVSYKLMALILIIVAAIGVTWYILRSNGKVASAKWAEFDSLGSSVPAMEEYAKKNPDTPQGRLAALDAARARLGREGIDRLSLADPAVRKVAVENIEKARESFTKLVDQFKDDVTLKTLCLLGCAKAEAVLVGMTKEGSTESRGDPKKAIELLDKVTEAAPDTGWGKDCKKLADALRTQSTEDQVRTLQTSVYTLDPKSPFDPKSPHGFPGGFPPDFDRP